MIRNHSLAYAAVESRILTWRAEDPVLHAFLVGALTTLIAYQTTAICFDLLVGFKQAGQSKLTDIGMVLLAEEGSIVSTAASLLNSDALYRWRFRGSKSIGLDNDFSDFRVGRSVLSKFLVLFLTAPVVSIISIIVSLEADRTLTFGQAKFGGIALRIGLDDWVLPEGRLDETCPTLRTDFRSNEVRLASFFACSERFRIPKDLMYNATTLSVSSNALEHITIRYQSRDVTYIWRYFVDMSTDRQAYRLRERSSPEQGRVLLKSGVQKLHEWRCPGGPGAASSGSRPEQPPPIKTIREDGKWNISQALECEKYPDKIIKNTGRYMTRSINVMEVEKLEVLNALQMPSNATATAEYMQGDNLPLLKRRRSFVSFVTLCIIGACLLACRVALKLISSNDIDMGIESIVKDSVGIKCCDSMLQNCSVVDYRNKTSR